MYKSLTQNEENLFHISGEVSLIDVEFTPA